MNKIGPCTASEYRPRPWAANDKVCRRERALLFKQLSARAPTDSHTNAPRLSTRIARFPGVRCTRGAFSTRRVRPVKPDGRVSRSSSQDFRSRSPISRSDVRDFRLSRRVFRSDHRKFRSEAQISDRMIEISDQGARISGLVLGKSGQGVGFSDLVLGKRDQAVGV